MRPDASKPPPLVHPCDMCDMFTWPHVTCDMVTCGHVPTTAAQPADCRSTG
jgi:hypothetical protein